MSDIAYTVTVLVIIIAIIGVVGFAIVFARRLLQKSRLKNTLSMSLYLVRLPRYTDEEDQRRELKDRIGVMEQLFSSMALIKKRSFLKQFAGGPERIVFEIASSAGEEEIGFYIATPKELETQVERNIHAVYPHAEVTRVVDDYNMFVPGNVVEASFLTLAHNPFLPLRTYVDMSADPLGSVVNAFQSISAQEGAAVQFVITPHVQSWGVKGRRVLEALTQGKRPEEAFKHARFLKSTFSGDSPAKHAKQSDPTKQQQMQQMTQYQQQANQPVVEAVQKKLNKVAFQTNIRLLVSAPTEIRAQQLLGQLESSFGQFNAPAQNSLRAMRVSKRKLREFIFNYSFRMFKPKHTSPLNVEELASMFHFPDQHIIGSKVKSLKTKRAAAPAELPKETVISLGTTTFRGQKELVGFASVNDRRRHLYIIGQTGTGKSTLLQELIRQDIEAGQGVAVIDPHGDTIEYVLSHIPKVRIDDVVLFEPFDMERPMGLNMLEYETPEQKDFAVQEMISIFYKLFPPEIIGPMFEHYMRNAMLAIMADMKNPGTLVEIPRVFTDDTYLQERLQSVSDPVVRQFWLKEWKQTTGQTRSDMLGYVVSKLGRFIENEMLRNIIGQTHSSFNFSEIMDGGKIFLANLSKGSTGEVNSSLLGLILVTKLQMAAMKRASMPENKRKDFYLYIDEFQNFTTDSIATILSEARKYRLDLTIAHQFIAQLEDKIRDSVFGNVGSLVAMRVGAEDGEALEKQFEPEFKRHDLVNLNNYEGVIKLMINGNTYNPFMLNTPPPKEGKPQIVGPLKELAKLKYSRPKQMVEREILARAKLGV